MNIVVCSVSGTWHGSTISSVGKMSGTVFARSHGHQQFGADMHIVRFPTGQPDSVVQRYGRIRRVHVLFNQGTGASRGNRCSGTRAQQRALHRSLSVVWVSYNIIIMRFRKFINYAQSNKYIGTWVCKTFE